MLDHRDNQPKIICAHHAKRHHSNAAAARSPLKSLQFIHPIIAFMESSSGSIRPCPNPQSLHRSVHAFTISWPVTSPSATASWQATFTIAQRLTESSPCMHGAGRESPHLPPVKFVLARSPHRLQHLLSPGSTSSRLAGGYILAMASGLLGGEPRD